MLSSIISLIPYCVPAYNNPTPIFVYRSYPIIHNNKILTQRIDEVLDKLGNIDACISLYSQQPDLKFSGRMMNSILERYLPPREFLLSINLNTLREQALEKVITAIGYHTDRTYLTFLVSKRLTYLINNPIVPINEYRLAVSTNNDREFTFLWNLSPENVKRNIPLALPLGIAYLASNNIKRLIHPYYKDGVLLQLSIGERIIPDKPVTPSIYYYLLKYNLPRELKHEIDECLQSVIESAPPEDVNIFVQIAKLLLPHGLMFPCNSVMYHLIHATMLLTVDDYWGIVPEQFTLDKCDVCSQLRDKFITY